MRTEEPSIQLTIKCRLVQVGRVNITIALFEDISVFNTETDFFARIFILYQEIPLVLNKKGPKE